MKRIYLALIFAGLLGVSCNKFLDEMPDNRTEINSKEKVARLLTSAYPKSTYAFFTNPMSDDYDDIGPYWTGWRSYTEIEEAWAWKVDSQEQDSDSPRASWDAHYLAIAHANQALLSIEEMGNPQEMNPQKGEALVARAWNHFKLVNLFSQHYTVANAGTDLGIPYITMPEEEVAPSYERGTVKAVYEAIERDLLAGLPLIDDSAYSVPAYHFNRNAALGFAAEFYLYYKKYDECIKYATEMLGENPEAMLRDVSTLSQLGLYDPQYYAYIDATVSANVMLVSVNSQVGLMTPLWSYQSRFIHTELNSFTEGLCSASVLWSTSTGGQSFQYPTMRYYAISGGPVASCRSFVPYFFTFSDPVKRIGFARSVMIAVSADNVLLMRAEANVMKETPDYAAAMEDINLWIRKRVIASAAAPRTEAQVETYYGTTLKYHEAQAPTARKRMTPETPFVDAKQEAFIQALMHMRRIEFHQEGQRWFDIKRYNIEVYRRHVQQAGGGATNTFQEIKIVDQLAPRDPRMAIQIPAGAILRGMTPNPR